MMFKLILSFCVGEGIDISHVEALDNPKKAERFGVDKIVENIYLITKGAE